MCEAKGVPKPAIQWIYNGKPIDQAAPNPRRTVQANKIVIKRLVKSDTGNYGCNATNSIGYVYKDVYVNVLGNYFSTLNNSKFNNPLFQLWLLKSLSILKTFLSSTTKKQL
jgi:hypothetical protein